MAYEKVNWDEGNTPLNTMNLNTMETQYDEALVHTEAARADSTIPLCVEVVSSFPAHAAGKIILHTGQGKGYYSNGSAWVEAFVAAEDLS